MYSGKKQVACMLLLFAFLGACGNHAAKPSSVHAGYLHREQPQEERRTDNHRYAQNEQVVQREWRRRAAITSQGPTTEKSSSLTQDGARQNESEQRSESSGASRKGDEREKETLGHMVEARQLSWKACAEALAPGRTLHLPGIPMYCTEKTLEFLKRFRDKERSREALRNLFSRARTYDALIEAALREVNLPKEVLYVAMAESRFEVRAKSPKRAVGLWQFGAATGRSYGLSSNRILDERRDPVLATQAASMFLARLKRTFGAFELTFAAYNMGYGGLRKAILKYNTNDFRRLAKLEAALPYQTYRYVSKIAAYCFVANNRKFFGLDEAPSKVSISESTVSEHTATEDRPHAPPPRFDFIEVPGSTSLAKVASYGRTRVAKIRSLNPALKRNYLPPGKRKWLRVPQGTASRLATNWPFWRKRKEAPFSYQSHSNIQHARELAIRLGNDFTKESTEVRQLPRRSRYRKIRRGEKPLVHVLEPTQLDPSKKRVFLHITEALRTDDVEKRVGLQTDTTRDWNALDPLALVLEGMYVQLFVDPDDSNTRESTLSNLGWAKVFASEDLKIIPFGSEVFLNHYEENKGRLRFVYSVKARDNMKRIAKRFGLKTADIARINRIARRSKLRTGQDLVIYAKRGRVPYRILRAAQKRSKERQESAHNTRGKETRSGKTTPSSGAGGAPPCRSCATSAWHDPKAAHPSIE